MSDSSSRTKGICYIAYGEAALREVRTAIRSLYKVGIDLPIALICNEPIMIEKIQQVKFEDRSFGARRVKVLLDDLSPFEQTLYLDVDTRVQSKDILKGFNVLDQGWDLVIAHSVNQGSEVFAHIDQAERKATSEYLHNKMPIQLQAGVMWFRKSPEVLEFFDAWRMEWNKFKHHDQAALIRALQDSPIRVWLLGLDWNSRRGSIVDHHFGQAVG